MAGSATASHAGTSSDQATSHQQTSAEPAGPPAQGPTASLESAASKQPPAAKRKSIQLPAATSSHVDGSTAGNVSAAPPSNLQSSSFNKRTLQALFPEGSTVSVLSKEGSELPGSRPPAQLHAALDGHDHGQVHQADMDEEEQEEIQKIISEIHGNGEESDPDGEPQDTRLANVKHRVIAGGTASSNNGRTLAAGLANPAASQQQTADEDSGVQQALVKPADQSDSAAEDYSQQPQEQQQLKPDSRQQDFQQAVVDSAPVEPATYAAGPGPSCNMMADEYTDSLSYALGMGPEGLIATAGYQDGAVDAAAGVGAVEEDERSRVIAEQLAQLHEESRRLQLQSQLLQHRAMEMSLQMTAGNAAPDGFLHPTQQHQNHHLAAAGSLNYSVTDTNQQGLAAKPSSGLSEQALGFSQAITPEGLALNPDALGLNEAVLPRHPPGDSTPSSVTSSRAGLNWNIPSRGSVASPSKMDAFSPSPASPYLVSADAQRPSFNTIAQGLALHADPSMDYQMYSYHHNASPASNSITSAPNESYHMQQQPQQQQPHNPQLYMHHQQHQQHALPDPLPTGRSHQATVASVSGASAAGDTGAHHKAFSTHRQQANSMSGAGGKGPAAVVVRRPTLPIKQGTGASTRVVAVGATAGRRSSCDNVGSYYGLVDDPAVVGTFNAAHAVAGAHGKVAKAKQQEAIGKLSPRGAVAGEAATAAGRGAGNTSTAATAGKHGNSSNAPPGAAGHRSRSVSPSGSPTAAALAAAAAAASGGGPGHSKSRNNAAVSAPAGTGQWSGMPANPYAAAAAAAAMYGGYAPVNPAMLPMMMKGPMHAAANATNSKRAAAGRAGTLGPEAAAMAAMAAAMPPGAAWMPVGVPPGFMPMMPQGSVSSPGSKSGPGPKGYMVGPMMAAGGVAHAAGGKGSAGHGNATVPGVARKGQQQMQAGFPFGMAGMPPAAFMGMPVPPVGFSNPYAMNQQKQGGMGPVRGANAAGKVLPNAAAGRVGKGPAAGAVAAGGFVPAGYVPAAAGYPAGGVGWNPMLSAAGQYGMMQLYNPAGGGPAGVSRQQQGSKVGKGVAAGSKGGWQA